MAALAFGITQIAEGTLISEILMAFRHCELPKHYLWKR